MRPVNKAYYAGFTVLIVLLLGFAWVYRQSIMSQLNTQIRGQFTVAERLDQFGTSAAQRLHAYFQQANLDFPPPKIALLAFKDSKQLQLYAPNKQGAWQWVHTYPIQAASGGLGPKLREGDKQVPEGLYQVELLNPNSLFHVSLRLNYPNAFDKQMAALDGREQLGGDIMIHGKAKSIGCLAMGDPAAEELFALAAWLGKDNLQVVIAPTDLRQANAALPDNVPAWTQELYAQLKRELANYPLNNHLSE